MGEYLPHHWVIWAWMGVVKVLGCKCFVPGVVHHYLLNNELVNGWDQMAFSSSVPPLTHGAYVWGDWLRGEKQSRYDLMPFPPEQSWLTSEGYMQLVLMAREKWWSSFVKAALKLNFTVFSSVIHTSAHVYHWSDQASHIIASCMSAQHYPGPVPCLGSLLFSPSLQVMHKFVSLFIHSTTWIY